MSIKRKNVTKVVNKVEDVVEDIVDDVKAEANETVGEITVKRWQAVLIAGAIAMGLIVIIL